MNGYYYLHNKWGFLFIATQVLALASIGWWAHSQNDSFILAAIACWIFSGYVLIFKRHCLA